MNEKLTVLLPQGWAEQVKAKVEKKMRYGAEKAAQVDFIPYSTQNGEWKKTDIRWCGNVADV